MFGSVFLPWPIYSFSPIISSSLLTLDVVRIDPRTESPNTQSAELQYEICKHYFAGLDGLRSDLLSTANALNSSRLDRTAYEAIVRQQPRCNMQLNGVDEMQAKDGCNVDE